MDTELRPSRWKILLAFAIIYLVWGSTFLAIRIGVREVPPFLLAGIRFFIAGIVLYAWMRAKGTPSPTRREWTAISFLAVLIFVFDYGLIFWAEKRVASGVTAVMMATIPVFMAIAEICFLRTQQLSMRLTLGLAVGIGGVLVLVGPLSTAGEKAIDTSGAVALIVAAISWTAATILTRKFSLPESKVMSSGAQMLVGGVLLILTSAVLREFNGFDVHAVTFGAWLALLYLIVAGSIVAFTAYVWLIHHESPTKVGTYAYVNPVIAVLLGYALAGESLSVRTIAGTLLILISVVVITTTPKKKLEISWREKPNWLNRNSVEP
ncbi:MAG: EamA family transporter [Candidatus Sulfotelmatobacter sp.]